MKPVIIFLSACMLATITRAQTPEIAGSASHASLQVETTKSIDAKKAKPGDEVTAVLTQDVLKQGKIILPRGSKVKGHVSEAQPRTKENPESRLGLVFEKVIAKGGREMECPCTVAALAPPMERDLNAFQSGNMGVPVTVGQPSTTRANVRGRRSGGVVTATPTGVRTVPGPDSVPSSTDNGNSRANNGQNGAVSSGSRGVIGLEGMHLASSSESGKRVSVVTSDKKTVKLESGTQLVLLISNERKKQADRFSCLCGMDL
ncbi:MAG TPA: hypothetical protein VFL42_10270 [Terriglobales bacterium]|nr:hypothetical protein [Terriglobales bacterium]